MQECAGPAFPQNGPTARDPVASIRGMKLRTRSVSYGPTAVNQDLTQHEIDASVSDVSAAAARLQWPSFGRELETTFHASLSTFIARELTRVRADDPVADVLPWELRTAIRRTRATAEPRELEPLVKLRITQWRNAVSELLARLERDWLSLVRYFSLDRDTKLMSLSEPLGDQHNNGRSVYKLTFDDGVAVVYKPRSVVAEHIIGRVVNWLDQHGCEPSLKSCRVFPRDSYGWAACVETRYCQSAEEANAFYTRQGAFIALFYLLGGTDCLGENAIVSREHPIWVDTECLCCPTLKQMAWGIPVPDWMRDSILSTGMVYSGKNLGLSLRRHVGLSLSCARHRSLVFNDNDALSARYLAASKSGLERLYLGIMSHTDSWAAGPLSWLTDCRTRVIPRGTHVYASMADWLLIAPADKRDAVWSAIDHALRELRQQVAWPDIMVQAELDALARGDVPYWTVATSSRDLQEASGRVVAGIATTTGLDCVNARLRRMSERDLQNQLWLVDSFLGLPD